MTNNENQLQRADMMKTPCPPVIAWCSFCYHKCVNLRVVTRIIIVVKQPLHLNVCYLQTALTFGKPGWIIVDVAEGDVDGGGSGQAPQLAPHVLGLD